MLPSPTKIIFRLINESRSACVRLASCAYTQPELPEKEAFYRVVEIIANELAQEHEVSGTIAMGSLRSNQYRYGKWHKIPVNERTADNYFKLRQDERDNGTINPDELEYQEHKRLNQNKFNPAFRKNTRTTATNTCIDVINSDKDYCIRLRNAAGEDKKAKHDFREVVYNIVNELKPHKFYRHTLISKLWKHGTWKDYIFNAPTDKAIAEELKQSAVIRDLINESDLYKRRLRQAAGPDKLWKDSFQHALANIISDVCYGNQIGYEETGASTLKRDMWASGDWHNLDYAPFKVKAKAFDFDFEAEQKPGEIISWHTGSRKDNEEFFGGAKWNNDAWQKLYMQKWPNESAAAHGTRAHRMMEHTTMHPAMYEMCSKDLKAAAKKYAEQHASDREKQLTRLLSGRPMPGPLMVGMDFAKIEARVAAQTGCTPEQLVNKDRYIGLDMTYGYGGATTGRWNSGCYAEKFPAKYGRQHQLDAYAFAARWMNKFTQPKKEEYRMEIKTQTLVNGITLDSLTNQDLISMISNTEDEIRTLEKLQTKSDHITNSIEAHKKSCAQLAGFLDART